MSKEKAQAQGIEVTSKDRRKSREIIVRKRRGVQDEMGS
jgi:hypothetical protein